MSRGVVRAIVLGAVLGLAVAVIAFIWATGQVDLQGAGPQEVLVIAEAPAADGSPAGALMFVLTREDDALVAEVIDPRTPATLAGTSASTLGELLPFGGGEAVADAYAEAEDADAPPEWVVLSPAAWTGLIDGAGGIAAAIPEDVSTYLEGELTTVKAGQSDLDGNEALAVVAAMPFIQDRPAANELRAELTDGLAGLLSARPEALASAVADGTAESSLAPASLEDF